MWIEGSPSPTEIARRLEGLTVTVPPKQWSQQKPTPHTSNPNVSKDQTTQALILPSWCVGGLEDWVPHRHTHNPVYSSLCDCAPTDLCLHAKVCPSEQKAGSSGQTSTPQTPTQPQDKFDDKCSLCVAWWASSLLQQTQHAIAQEYPPTSLCYAFDPLRKNKNQGQESRIPQYPIDTGFDSNKQHARVLPEQTDDQWWKQFFTRVKDLAKIVNTHHCNTGCYKGRKKGEPCRYRYPRPGRCLSAMVDGVLVLRRTHNWVNNYNPTVSASNLKQHVPTVSNLYNMH